LFISKLGRGKEVTSYIFISVKYYDAELLSLVVFEKQIAVSASKG
jgi:hypothetical protein